MSPHMSQLPQRALLFALSFSALVACSKEKFAASSTGTTSTAATTTSTTPYTTSGTGGGTVMTPPPQRPSQPMPVGGGQSPPPQRPLRPQPQPQLPVLQSPPVPHAPPVPQPTGVLIPEQITTVELPIMLVCANPISIVDPVLTPLTDVHDLPAGHFVLRSMQMFKILNDGQALLASTAAADSFRLRIQCAIVRTPGLPLIANAQMTQGLTFLPELAPSWRSRAMNIRVDHRRLREARSVAVQTKVPAFSIEQLTLDHAARADGSVISMRVYMPTPQTWEARVELERQERDGRTSSEFIRAEYELVAP